MKVPVVIQHQQHFVQPIHVVRGPDPAMRRLSDGRTEVMYHDPGRPTAVLGTPRFNDPATPRQLEAGRSLVSDHSFPHLPGMPADPRLAPPLGPRGPLPVPSGPVLQHHYRAPPVVQHIYQSPVYRGPQQARPPATYSVPPGHLAVAGRHRRFQ
eukprot:TRINITY_DN8772_c0_g1_i1.p2 TRINITY_DN8772_c0_g1~~TRINITY_DN8772_c0_g1_i1.p2  ORF type:complete len:154 (+),score=17.44 TRINITY_DN8772_c0_g1_i1:515-976(+)